MAPRSKRGRISIHAPLAGCDRLRCARAKMDDISIHAPLAGCDSTTGSTSIARILFQSTHPLRGATRPRVRQPSPVYYFNPRTPCGVRPTIPTGTRSAGTFQSTHPLRGATIKVFEITIVKEFQSTHPLRGATMPYRPSRRRERISIHAPLAGCDNQKYNRLVVNKISIHAPLAGCDSY